METTTLKKRKKISVDKKIKDHSNDPFVVKKINSAKRLLEKKGLLKKIKQLAQ
jgi:hypothetical protein